MSENARIRTRLLMKLAGTIVLAGALLAGFLFPWVGGSGLAAATRPRCSTPCRSS